MIARAGASAVRIVTAVVVAGLLWLGVEVAAGLTLQAWDDRRQLVGAQRLTVALETFRPSEPRGVVAGSRCRRAGSRSCRAQ